MNLSGDERVVRISVDAMGGDFAPAEVVKGSVEAAREEGVEILLVGPQDTVESELRKYNTDGLPIQIVEAGEYLVEGEHPAVAIRQKRNASIVVATKLVRDGKADAVVGAGPTGGVVASALTILGCVADLSRPVVGGTFIGLNKRMVAMDLGGNVDCQPYQLLDSAIVGTVYAKKYLNIENPRVGLLSIGAEEGKGNAQNQETYPIFKKSNLNFIGNVEGLDLLSGRADVIICDGFVGNIVVKFTEAMGYATARWLEKNLSGKISDEELKALTTAYIAETNPAEALGGGPLLGVNGVVVVAHGRSKAQEVTGAIQQARDAVETGLVEDLRVELEKAHQEIGYRKEQ
jgi:glycerol-3-phosphate acyltransferase PlsX